jgi:hypothetical protein
MFLAGALALLDKAPAVVPGLLVIFYGKKCLYS